MFIITSILLSNINNISLVKVYGATVFSEKEIIEVSNIRKGKPFRMAVVRGGEIRIKGLYESKGYFMATVKDSVVQTDRGMEVHLFIDEGPRAKIVDIIPEGMESIDSLS
ncbi:MAG: POTRA domain-containing protein, partial [Candidatus Hydrothermia bacterium]